MKPFLAISCLAMLAFSLRAQETPEVIPLPPSNAPTEPGLKETNPPEPRPKISLLEEALEDRIESALEKAGAYYEKKERAKCGGALFEAAEILEELAGEQQSSAAGEADLLRVLALEAARGKLDARKVDQVAALSCQKLAHIFLVRAQSAWKSGKSKEAGRTWYRASAFLERSVQWSGFGLTETGNATVDTGKVLAEALATGEPADAKAVVKAMQQTESMIQWIRVSLIEKSGLTIEESASTGAGPESQPGRATANFFQEGTDKIVHKVKTGAVRLGQILKKLGEE